MVTKRRQLIGLLVIAVMALAILGGALLAERWAYRAAAATAEAEAAGRARDNAALFASEMQKFRLLPIALSEYPDVIALLSSGGDPGEVNAELARLAERTNAAALYLIGADGRTLAASNYRTPESFVGRDYRFRPYFIDAMKTGSAELFALGTVSGRPGLFIAGRVGGAKGPLGVVVVKIEFGAIERDWARQPGQTFVADRHGVVIVTSRPDWRFQTLQPLDPQARAAIAAARQFEGQSLTPLPLRSRAGAIVSLDGSEQARAAVPAALEGAELIAFAGLAPALAAARARAGIVGGGVLVALIAAALLLRRITGRARAAETLRLELERRVEARTAELSAANVELQRQSAERARADRRYREAREELAQANRLGTLGQVVAGVAHELNQPAAAIRAFAENAAVYLGRGEPAPAAANLDNIVQLTGRLESISGELRRFARRRAPQIGAVMLDDAIDGALLIIGHRAASAQVRITRRAVPGVNVAADRVRLEQVLVNLLQNAIDALATTPDGEIAISAEVSARSVAVRVADNGPGVDAEVAREIFAPFKSGGDGLGLGLAIARDIMRSFDGDLILEASTGSGATFLATLRAL